MAADETPEVSAALDPQAVNASSRAGGVSSDRTSTVSLDFTQGEPDHETTARVADFFNSLDKAVRARRLYASNNPAYVTFLNTLKHATTRLWDEVHSLPCVVDESVFRWDNHAFTTGEGRENLSFLFYKDGIRVLTFLPGFEDEAERFLNVVARVRHIDQNSADDMVTLLWEQEFTSIQYSYVDALAEGLEVPESGRIAFEKIELTLVADDLNSPISTDPAQQSYAQEQNLLTVAQSITREDFSETLYFLEQTELEYLKNEVEREIQRDLKADVLNALFDRLEDPVPQRQTEILRIVRQLLPAYLSGGDLRSASTILIELNTILNTGEVLGESQKKDAQEIFAELSDPAVLNQLLKSLEDGAIDPSGEELRIFLKYLRPSALAPLIRATETTRRAELQQRLRTAIEGLGREHPEILADLVRNDDPAVVTGTARLAGRIGLTTAVPALASLLNHSHVAVRRASVEALVQIKSGAALDALQNALEDTEREVRIAAARGIGGLRYQPARPRLEAVLNGRIVRDADLTEKMAFFDAFGSVANADSVAVLDRILNGKKFLGGKESPELRACAAMALGKLSAPAARAALERAADEKEPMVRNAVIKALRQESAAT